MLPIDNRACSEKYYQYQLLLTQRKLPILIKNWQLEKICKEKFSQTADWTKYKTLYKQKKLKYVLCYRDSKIEIPVFHCLPICNSEEPRGNSWERSAISSGVRLSNSSLQTRFSFLKFSTSRWIRENKKWKHKTQWPSSWGKAEYPKRKSAT